MHFGNQKCLLPLGSQASFKFSNPSLRLRVLKARHKQILRFAQDDRLKRVIEKRAHRTSFPSATNAVIVSEAKDLLFRSDSCLRFTDAQVKSFGASAQMVPPV